MNARSVLVIDPERNTHELIREILERGDRVLHDAFDRASAEECLGTARYDVVIAGQGRNGADGLRMARRVRSLQPEARIVLLGDSAPQHIICAIRARVFGYCHNPPPPGPLNDIVQQALEAVAWQNDILVVSALPQWITLDVRCKMEAGDRATHFIRELVCDLPLPDREDVTSAFRELLLNGVEHGGKYNPKKRVRVWMIRTNRALIVQIQDPGTGFSLNSLPHAAISNPEDSPIRHVEIRAEAGQRPGGFGILMTRNLVDELIYNENGNAVMFIKYLTGEAVPA